MGTSCDFLTCCMCGSNFHCMNDSYLDCSNCNNVYCYYCSDECENHMTKKQIKNTNIEGDQTYHIQIKCCGKCCVKPSHLGQYYTSNTLWILKYYLQTEADTTYIVFDKLSEAEKLKKQIYKTYCEMLNYEDITIEQLEIRRYC